MGPPAFVFFLLLTLRLGIGKSLPFCSCCFCPVWCGSRAEVMGGEWILRSHMPLTQEVCLA